MCQAVSANGDVPLYQKPKFTHMLSVAMTLLSFAPCVQGWQPESFKIPTRIRTMRQKRQLGRHFDVPMKEGGRGTLFPSISTSHRRWNYRGHPLLFETINGDDSSSTKTRVAAHAVLGRSRRARLRSHVSNIWSTIRSKNGRQLEASRSTPPTSEEIVQELETENTLLRETVRQLENENERLASQRRIILENFEGEGFFQTEKNSMNQDLAEFGITLSEAELAGDISSFRSPSDQGVEQWCDELDEDSCPVEPSISFGAALRDRAYWLVGLLIMQSCSGIILSRNEALLANHPVIIYFLTMLVGAGGNAGNQASVRGKCTDLC